MCESIRRKARYPTQVFNAPDNRVHTKTAGPEHSSLFRNRQIPLKVDPHPLIQHAVRPRESFVRALCTDVGRSVASHGHCSLRTCRQFIPTDRFPHFTLNSLDGGLCRYVIIAELLRSVDRLSPRTFAKQSFVTAEGS